MKTTDPTNHRLNTCRPSVREKQLVEKFDPLSNSVIESYAGLITRAVVDIARYNRSIAKDCTPESADHYQRLIRATEYLTQSRMLNLSITDPDAASGVKELVDSVEWPTVYPEVNFPLAYDGSEPAISVTFVPYVVLSQRETLRQQLPA